eukprot:5123094-Lingulodinium_polyedra.AAC.1
MDPVDLPLGSQDKPEAALTVSERTVSGRRKILRHILRIRRLHRIWAHLGIHLQRIVPRIRDQIRGLR